MTIEQEATTFDHGVRAFRPHAAGTRGVERHDAIVIGAGQAGLSAGYHLARRGIEFVVLDENERVGDGWRTAWDSLRLFTPARYNGLPGMAFPGDPSAYATRDEMADYLRAYAERFELPVRAGVAVDGLRALDSRPGYLVTAGERRFEARNVVVATGAKRIGKVPAFAAGLDPSILQLHSSEYRNLEQLPPGPVLVVGASHSGADIALETASAHETVLAGPFRGQVPWDIEKRVFRVIAPLLWLIANHVLTLRTPMGRKLRPQLRHHGAPLLRVKRGHLDAAGVEHVAAKVVGVRDGLPLLDGGRTVAAATVIWCTGFRRDYGWIDLPILGEDGYPVERRGVVPSAPGLFFVGLPFQRSFASMLIGGVGRDAEDVVAAIAAREPAVAA
jgi:putative flavoprotein involved in K+ transport